MTKSSPSLPTHRPLKLERNREKLLASAKGHFAERGAAASLEQIARDAKVGIGTLYRHFPTRDSLIEAVYRQETDILVEAASSLSANKAPLEALQAWLVLFINFLETKQHIRDVLDSLIGGPEALYSDTPARLSPPIEMLVTRANETGKTNINIAPLDVLRAIAGVATIRPSIDWKKQTGRLVELLLADAGRPMPR